MQTNRTTIMSKAVKTALSSVLLTFALPLDGALAQEPTGQGPGTTQGPGQQTIERLRRDQDEIMHKAERLKKLMLRLMKRYQREKKQEQVDYLKEGLAHLERSGVLNDVATIREDLESTAFTEALRKQRDVVSDLERLLNILLARKSIENIDDEMKIVTEQAQTAAELERRQRELIDKAQQTMESELSPAEQELADTLAEMRDAEQREADRNAQQAGTRRPFLESALSRIKELLNAQKRLESGLEDEASGRTPDAKTQAFDLGDLSEQVRQLQRDLRDQKQQQQLGKAGQAMQDAAVAKDAQALQQARDRLDSLLETAPKLPNSPGEFKDRDPEWEKVRAESKAAQDVNSETGQEALKDVGKHAEANGKQRDGEANQQNGSKSDKLSNAAKELSDRLKKTAPQPTGNEKGKQSADAVADASKQLADAKKALDEGDIKKADELVNKALSALDQARSKHRKENPDAARNADKMAADARAAAQELANAPIQQDAEQTAQTELDQASKALRDVAKQVEDAREAGEPAEAKPAADKSRQSLEAAKEAIEKALDDAAENNEAELDAAQQRQQQLAQQAQAAKQQMQQAGQKGDINKEQQQAAEKALDQAQKSMQKAQSQLQKGQQASAAQQQEQAADQMQKAMDALQENREMSPEQKDQLAKQAEAQDELTEDIIKLAEELKKRQNKAAERAAQEAADASRKAQRAMEEGDTEETERQQEKAREKLEEATDELQEEKDRYQDLRQEELLFRMKDELTVFLEKQRPITEATKQFQKSSKGGRLSRPVRRKVNGLGEEEQSLAGKIEFLVTALTEEGNLVYQSVLSANLEDLREVARRLAGRAPDVGSFTTLLQDDVERRSVQLLEALEREMKRREEERKEEQEEQKDKQKSENKFNQQRKMLVSLIADLEMLKSLGGDTQEAMENLKMLVEVRGDESISEAEISMIQRLAHRHNEITKLFEQIKVGVEEALNAQGGGEEEEGGSGR
ncbi:MAG: hypothetical protein ACI89X_000504 [Planctomycetota bacterium]|jgi:hypothetical protein